MRQQTRMKRWSLWGGWLVLCVGLSMMAACGPSNDNNQNSNSNTNAKPVDLPNVAEADRDAMVKGQTEFAINLYKQLSQENPGKNLFFSPYSISVALSMTYAGAANQTATQMKDTLKLPFDDDRNHAAIEWLRGNLYNRSLGGQFSMQLANRLFVQKGYPLLKSFTDLLNQHYGAGLEEVDYGSDVEAARQTINKWVEQQTNDRIKDLFPKDSLRPDTRLVLANAIYFLGNWKDQFDPKRTYQGDFEVSSEKTVKVDLMRKEMSVPFAKIDDSTTIFSLPYKGEELSLVVVLHKDINLLEAGLSEPQLTSWIGKQNKGRSVVILPKVKITQSFDMGATLEAMGMTDAFSAVADFSGITDAEKLMIQKVVHKAFLEVNETGTEAAAATGVSVGPTSVPPTLSATRPFLLLIRDNKTGSILFMGKILDPSLQ